MLNSYRLHDIMRAQKGVPMINQLAGYFDQMAAIIRRIEDKEIFREKDFASLLGDKNHQIYFELITKTSHT